MSYLVVTQREVRDVNYPFRNLVFEGGGVRGIAYVGVLGELQQRGILENIVRVGGTSAGAINAVLMALGYTLEETHEVLSTLDFRKFMDPSRTLCTNAWRLVSKFGWCKGDFFGSWIGDLIFEKSGQKNPTFKELGADNYRALYLIGTNLSTSFAEVFSAEHTPEMRVVDAVRRSMSIPIYFAAVRDKRKDVFVDGGVFDNYPIKLFDRVEYIDKAVEFSKHVRETKYYEEINNNLPDPTNRYVYNKQTLGFRLDGGREIAMFWEGKEPEHHYIKNVGGYAYALGKAIMNVQANQHLHSDDWHRTVYIDASAARTTEFTLSGAQKENLIREGEKGVKRYFQWYDEFDPEDPPKNHPDYVDE